MRVGHLSGILAAALVVLTGCGDDSAGGDPDARPAIESGPIAVAATELVAGDCLRGIVIGGAERRELSAVEAVSCSGTHDLEVFATFQLQVSEFDNTPPGEYPGIQRVVDAADDGCLDRFDELGADRETIGLIAAWPTAQSWGIADRTVACAAFSADGTPFQRPSLISADR